MTEAHYKNWLTYIKDIAYDRDCFSRNILCLEWLADELRRYAISALSGDDCPLDQYQD